MRRTSRDDLRRQLEDLYSLLKATSASMQMAAQSLDALIRDQMLDSIRARRSSPIAPDVMEILAIAGREGLSAEEIWRKLSEKKYKYQSLRACLTNLKKKGVLVHKGFGQRGRWILAKFATNPGINGI